MEDHMMWGVQDVQEVKEIIARMEIYGVVEYLVKWSDGSECWLDECKLSKYSQLIAEFNKKNI